MLGLGAPSWLQGPQAVGVPFPNSHALEWPSLWVSCLDSRAPAQEGTQAGTEGSKAKSPCRGGRARGGDGVGGGGSRFRTVTGVKEVKERGSG